MGKTQSTSGWNRSVGFFFTAAMKRFVLNLSKHTDGCFTTAFIQTQHGSFPVQCGDRTAVGCGNTNEQTCLRARAAKQPHGHQSSSAVRNKCNILDLYVDVFNSE
jgi:hypothetical protein